MTSANVVAFPAAAIYRPVEQRTARTDESFVGQLSRILEKSLYEKHDGKRSDSPQLGAFASHLHEKFKRRNREERDRVQRWHARSNWEDSELAFVAESDTGIATDHFGQGSDIYRAGVSSVSAKEIVRSESEALQLAINQLNAIGTLARHGGFHSSHSDGYNEMADDHPEFVLADLGRTLARLKKFGARAAPDAVERRVLARKKRAFDKA